MGFIAFMSDKEFSIPMWEVFLLMIVNSVCLLLGKHKTGLVVSYIFVFHWGYVFNRSNFVDLLGNMTWGMYIYTILGALMAIVIIIGFFVRSE